MTKNNPELCSKCGVPIYRRDHPTLRMCSRHAREHLASLPPFACTSADLAARDPANDPECESCGHLWSAHEFGGCVAITARMVFSYGELVEDKPPGPCGCEEIDPMCQTPPPNEEAAPSKAKRT